MTVTHTLATKNTRGIIETAGRLAEELLIRTGGASIAHAVLPTGWEKRILDGHGTVIGVVSVRLGDPDTVVETRVVEPRPNWKERLARSMRRRGWGPLDQPLLTAHEKLRELPDWRAAVQGNVSAARAEEE